MVKILLMTIYTVNIFTIHESLLQSVIKILATIYQNKAKIIGKSGKFRFNFITCKVSYINRPIHRRCSIKIGVPKNFSNFTGKQLYQSLFFNKVAPKRHKIF